MVLLHQRLELPPIRQMWFTMRAGDAFGGTVLLLYERAVHVNAEATEATEIAGDIVRPDGATIILDLDHTARCPPVDGPHGKLSSIALAASRGLAALVIGRPTTM